MKIKKFQAENYSEALKLVKQELGDDAVILSTEEKKGKNNEIIFEVTAAIDYEINRVPSIPSPPKKQLIDKKNISSFDTVLNDETRIDNSERNSPLSQEKG